MTMREGTAKALLGRIDLSAEIIKKALLEREEITTDSEYETIFSEIIELAEKIIEYRSIEEDFTIQEARGYFLYLATFRRKHYVADSNTDDSPRDYVLN